MSSRLEAFSSEVKRTDNGTVKPSIVNQPDPVDATGNNLTSSSQDLRDKLVSKRGSSAFPRKIFQMRPSILTELLEVSHIRSIRQIFISILVILVLQVAITDLFERGTYVSRRPFCTSSIALPLLELTFVSTSCVGTSLIYPNASISGYACSPRRVRSSTTPFISGLTNA